MEKILIIRFSSFGDICQCMSVTDLIVGRYPDCEIDWVVRSDFSEFLKIDGNINRIWNFDKKSGITGLIKLALNLRKQKYDIVYDAHNNIRSLIIKMVFILLFSRTKIIIRSKNRFKRFLLFYLKINLFSKPFRAIDSYQKPFKSYITIDNSYKPKQWNIDEQLINQLYKKNNIKSNIKDYIIIAPSAAWEMKRWPEEYWIDLVKELIDYKFIILGGPGDQFCDNISNIDPERIINLAGKISILESCMIVNQSSFFISADTGILHVGDLLGKNGIALIGPTAFGGTKSISISVLDIDLSCRPCTKDGRGNCNETPYKKCMINIKPKMVSTIVKERYH